MSAICTNLHPEARDAKVRPLLSSSFATKTLICRDTLEGTGLAALAVEERPPHGLAIDAVMVSHF